MGAIEGLRERKKSRLSLGKADSSDQHKHSLSYGVEKMSECYDPFEITF